jgi:hypothetical protein
MWQKIFPKNKNPRKFLRNRNSATEYSLFIFIFRILAKFGTSKKKNSAEYFWVRQRRDAAAAAQERERERFLV